MNPLLIIAGAVGAGAVLLLWPRRASASEPIGEVSVTVEKKPAPSVYVLATRSPAPRNVRDNNPGNLRFISSNPFNGQIGNDGGYGIYDTVLNGGRANFLNLKNYFTRYGLDTVRDIVTKWAPAADSNPTERYISFVATQLGVSPDQPLNYATHARSLMKALARFEAGFQPWTDQFYADAFRVAG